MQTLGKKNQNYHLNGINKKHITKLQSGCRGQAAPPFKQLLCGRPHWGAYLISKSPLAYNNKEDFYEKKSFWITDNNLSNILF